MAFMEILLGFLLIRLPILIAEDCTTGFSVVAPELAVPGKTTAVLVTLHGPSSLQPLNVTLRLTTDDYDVSQQLVETTQEIRGHGIIPLEVPADATGSYTLQTLVNCTDGEECNLQSSSQMRLVGPVRDVIIRPARHTYRPGETVSFWVLALDHDLQITSNALGVVSVRDPAGTKVALWDQVSLDEGVKSFTLPLSEMARSGRWTLQVEVESSQFTAPIEVTAGMGPGAPDVAVAEEHYVELRFGREMRRRYKPGLPFVGKVEAMSTEKSVRVRVKVYDNTTAIYSQDIEISAGEGTFIVPAILADSDVIALQAELVSVEGREIESHYVLAREPIHKWNSSSDCYLLIEGVEHTLQPEEEAHVTILSTCPCERDLHYVITTDSRVTDWAQRRYEDPVPPTAPTSSAVCKLNFSFIVRSVMAPVSQLLVYYVTPQGEPVSDVISFDVKLLHRQVYVSMEEREWWLPGQSLDLEVVAEPSSLVCLLGGRAGSGNDIKFNPRISDERQDADIITGEVDFLEAGVSFFQRQCVKRGESGVSAVSYRQRGSGAGPSSRRRPPESLVGGEPFDKLWLWKCFNYTSEIAASGMTVVAPDEAGKWSLWALTVASGGLRFSSPVNIQVFRPLQVDFILPPSLRVGETLEVDVKIGNNINTCMDVTSLLALSEGAQFLSNGLLYVTERLRLGPHGATSLVVRLLVTKPGLKNMTVEVNGYTSTSCEGAVSNGNTSLAGAVVKSATVMVQPEGVVRKDTESAYFCANENTVISASDSFKYEWVGAPRNRAGFVLEMRAGSQGNPGAAHIVLAESRSSSDRMYRLVVGDTWNSVTWLGRGKHGYGVQLTSVATPVILSSDQWRTFWLTWEKNTIIFGRGSVLNNDTLLKWPMDKKIKIQQVGFASTWGSAAEFRIWNYNDEAGFSQVLHLDIPRSIVPGSESGELLIAGGLELPCCPSKLKQPGGGLSGALSALTPLLTLQHLGSKANESHKKSVLAHLPGHIQTILSYRKMDNSFSEHNMLGSHASTIRILEVLTKAQSFFNVDPELIQSIKRWVQLRQEDDGSFTPLPADVKFTQQQQSFPSTSSSSSTTPFKNVTVDLLSLERIVEITAETIITLFEIGVETDADSEVILGGRLFLESNLNKVKSPTSLAVLTLALVLLKSSLAHAAVERLTNMTTMDEGDFGWPYLVPKRDAADWLYESEAGRTLKEPTITSPEEYKASVYTLWTYCVQENLKLAETVARYLYYRSHMLDMHPEFLYPAVKAFNMFDTLAKDQHRSLTISLATSGMELTDTLELRYERFPSVLHLPSLPTKVFVYATGAGCATIQGRTVYSTYAVSSKTPLLELWSGVVQEIVPEHASVEELDGKLPMLKLKTCFRWKSFQPSGVLRLEVTLFSGFELASTTPVLIDPTSNMAELQHGSRGNNLWFVFANVTSLCPICVQYLVRSIYVISSLKPAYARMYPAGREDMAAETFFHTHVGSDLLAGITDDDLITWFGQNDTYLDSGFDKPCDCEQTCITSASTSETEPTTSSPPSTQPVSPTGSSSSSAPSSKAATLSTTAGAQATISTTEPNKKDIELDDLSYTINVDNDSIANITEIKNILMGADRPIIVPTIIPSNTTTTTTTTTAAAATTTRTTSKVTQKEPISTTTEATTSTTIAQPETTTKRNDALVLHENKTEDTTTEVPTLATTTAATSKVPSTTVEAPKVTSTKAPVRVPVQIAPMIKRKKVATDDKLEPKTFRRIVTKKVIPPKKVIVAMSPKISSIEDAKKVPIINNNINTTKRSVSRSEEMKVMAENGTSSSSSGEAPAPAKDLTDLIVDTNVSPPRHINTEKHQVPIKYLMDESEEKDKQPPTFGPDSKNNKYVVVDKDALWGMLREVVSDELSRKRSNVEA